ncbi:DUF2147 domain-containing protein [Aquabacterium sp.]|uniref:DUF2147 domain-containing protein n=1 Tax=Aquabacterium sp. TaxID=1872578 RepID=UPI0035B1A750
MKLSFWAVVLGVMSVCAAAQGTPVGLWKTVDDHTGRDKSQIRIVEDHGVLFGRVEKLLDPEVKSGIVCDLCTDDRKDKPVLGMTVIRNVKHSDKDPAVWEGGDILDPKNGNVYRVRMTPVESGKKLEVRGFIGAPVFGRTQTWIRIE